VTSVFTACEAGVSIKPGAQAPGPIKNKAFEPAQVGDSVNPLRCRPFHGLARPLDLIPGACAPGFMLSPALQVQAFHFLLRWNILGT